MSDEQGPPPFPPPDRPERRIGPYEQSLREQSAQIARAVARRAARRRRNRILAGAAALAVLGGGAFGAMQLFDGPSATTPSASSTSAVPEHCDDPNTVTVALPAALGPALTEVAAALAEDPDGPCTTFDLQTQEAAIVARTLQTGSRPDGWITDSGFWVEQATAAGATVTPAEPFASSAIVVAMSPERAQSLSGQPSWADLMGGADPVRFPDPSRSTVGLLSLSAAGAAQAAGLPGAVTAAARAPAPTVEPASLAQIEQAPAVPVAEAALLGFNRSSPGDALAAVAPKEGTAPLEYSLVPTTEDDAAASSIEALSAFLGSDAAKGILTDHGFRVPGGAQPTSAEPLVGSVVLADPPSAALADQVRSLWAAANAPRRVLVALDVSGSMLTRTEEGTRLAIAQHALRTALASLPDTSSAALWAFSNHIGVQGDDFKALTGYGVLGDAKHRAALEKAVAGLEQTVGGGSGLYDSVLAAYVNARNAYQAGQTNVLVVVVDGPNEDDYGLDLNQLKAKLAAERDRARPVQVQIVGVGDSVDEDELTAIAQAAGGRYIAAPRPDDLRGVLVRAVTGY